MAITRLFSKRNIRDSRDYYDKKEQRNYTDAITQQILQQAGQSQYTPPAVVEVAAGLASRAFASAEVTGRDSALFDAMTLAEVGRDFISTGEWLGLRRNGRLFRVLSYTIQEDGSYRLEISPRGGLRQTSVASSDDTVVHARYITSRQTLRGIAPLDTSPNLKSFLFNLEQSLTEESRTPNGFLTPIPTDGGDEEIDDLKQQLSDLKGRVALVKTMSGGWDSGVQNRLRREFDAIRYGMQLPDTTVRMYEQTRRTALALFGVPIELTEPADGTGKREAWRQYLHATISPLAKMFTAACERSGLSISLDFSSLYASDIAGRARAFQSLVASGMDIEEAATVSGIMTEE